MIKKTLLAFLGLVVGLGVGYIVTFYTPIFSPKYTNIPAFQSINGQKQIIGFLPYWLLDKASSDYSSSITTLTYFGIRVDKDGSILKLTTPVQEESGWYALQSGKLDTIFTNAKKHNVNLSLLVASGNSDTIDQLVSSPIQHAQTLAQNVAPLIQKYGFSDINLDIEYTLPASDAGRTHFTEFVKEVKKDLPSTTLTVEISPTDAIQKNLIDVKELGGIANFVVIMAYDYHAPDSFVTGPVAPLLGAGITSEYDVTTAVQKTFALVPSQKIILGIPLYGYEWETLGTTPRSAIIPGTGILASNKRAEEFLASCATCSAQLDADAHEKYISYYSDDTKTNHLLFYPDVESTKDKVQLANTMELGGLALWALGYEGDNMLSPLTTYK